MRSTQDAVLSPAGSCGSAQGAVWTATQRCGANRSWCCTCTRTTRQRGGCTSAPASALPPAPPPVWDGPACSWSRGCASGLSCWSREQHRKRHAKYGCLQHLLGAARAPPAPEMVSSLATVVKRRGQHGMLERSAPQQLTRRNEIACSTSSHPLEEHIKLQGMVSSAAAVLKCRQQLVMLERGASGELTRRTTIAPSTPSQALRWSALPPRF